MKVDISRLKINTMKYHEAKPHHLKRIIWAVVNATIFRISPQRTRFFLLRVFGAKVSSGVISRSVKIYAPWNLVNEHSCCVGPDVEIYNKDKVFLGVQAIVSQGAYICTASHDVTSPNMKLVTKPVIVDSQAWVASRAIILPGVTVGEGAVVGCGSVVAKDVAPWTVVAGNPARVVGKREIRDVER